MTFDPDVDPTLTMASYTSSFFPDEPEYVKQAWRTFIDSMRDDRKQPKEKGKRKVRVSWESQLAFNAWCRSVAQAKADGVAAHQKLDIMSIMPSILPEDDGE